MADTDPNRCVKCGKAASDIPLPLKRCSRCKKTHYCTKECQKADWKSHKKICASIASDNPPPFSSTADSPPAYTPKNLSAAVEKPFHKLDAGTWLHDRPEQDVYKLLVDAYRMRMEDNYALEGDADVDSIYGGAPDGRQGFKRFLRLAERRRNLLPSWWSPQHAAACMTDRGWSDLGCAIEKSDIIEHYGDRTMPMQLRMFAEVVYGRGPAGHDGSQMRQIQMMAERGEGYSGLL